MRGMSAFLVMALATAASAGWEDNRCVTCHEIEVLPISLGHTFADWQGSAHARGGVGCEKCHGGDARAADDAAHRGVLPATDPASLVAPARLPSTCGACHKKELQSFESTAHARQLRERGSGATCFTCHRAMATSFPTPRELAERCAVCHDKPLEAQAALAVLATSKMQLRRTQSAMDAARAANPTWYDGALERFHTLERESRDIELSWHTFQTKQVLQDARDLLKLAKSLSDEASVMAHHHAK